jgi:adenylylsulfate kinase-like enzyme
MAKSSFLEMKMICLDMVVAGTFMPTTFISPFRAEPDMARNLFNEGEFIEVFFHTTLEIFEQRDVKGL